MGKGREWGKGGEWGKRGEWKEAKIERERGQQKLTYSPFPPPFPFPRRRESPYSRAIGANYKAKRRERCSPRLSHREIPAYAGMGIEGGMGKGGGNGEFV